MPMALESPLKKEIDDTAKQIDILNREYNKYFQGAEDEPPRDLRKKLEAAVQSLKSAIATSASASFKFSANAVIAKHRVHAAKWDKTLRLLEEGKMTRPKKRE